MPTVAAAIATRAATKVSIRRRLRVVRMSGSWARRAHLISAAGGDRASAPANEAVDRPVQRGGEELAIGCFAERAQTAHPETGPSIFACPAGEGNQRADLAGAEVPVDVAEEERAQPGAPDHVATDERTLRSGEAVDLDRLHGPTRRRRMGPRVGSEAFEIVPPEVGAGRSRKGEVVDLVEAILADVPDRDAWLTGIGDQVEREPEGVAQADRIDPHSVGARIDLQQLAEAGVGVLGVVGLVAGAPAVSGARVEQAVGAELQLAAVVVGLVGVGHDDDRPQGGG